MGAKNYHLEDSAEIEKIFMNDARDKKRIGRGVFNKVGKGGDRANVKGGLRFASDSLKGKEKREYKKAGRMNVYNMNEIISYEALKEKSKEDQKQILEFWREKYSNQEIMDAMGIEKNKFYRLMDGADVQRKAGKAKSGKTYGVVIPSIEEIELYKKKVPDVELFKTWTRPVQYHIMMHWQNIYSLRELHEKMGIENVNNMYSLWGAIRTWINNKGEQIETFLPIDDDLEKREKEKREEAKRLLQKAVEVEKALKNGVEEVEPEMEQTSILIVEDDLMIDEIEEVKETFISEKEETVIEETGIVYKLNGIYSSKILSEKLEKILLLIDEEENNFHISLDLKEIKVNKEEKTNNNDEMDSVRLALMQLTEILAKK